MLVVIFFKTRITKVITVTSFLINMEKHTEVKNTIVDYNTEISTFDANTYHKVYFLTTIIEHGGSFVYSVAEFFARINPMFKLLLKGTESIVVQITQFVNKFYEFVKDKTRSSQTPFAKLSYVMLATGGEIKAFLRELPQFVKIYSLLKMACTVTADLLHITTCTLRNILKDKMKHNFPTVDALISQTTKCCPDIYTEMLKIYHRSMSGDEFVSPEIGVSGTNMEGVTQKGLTPDIINVIDGNNWMHD